MFETVGFAFSMCEHLIGRDGHRSNALGFPGVLSDLIIAQIGFV